MCLLLLDPDYQASASLIRSTYRETPMTGASLPPWWAVWRDLSLFPLRTASSSLRWSYIVSLEISILMCPLCSCLWFGCNLWLRKTFSCWLPELGVPLREGFVHVLFCCLLSLPDHPQLVTAGGRTLVKLDFCSEQFGFVFSWEMFNFP